MLQEKIQQYSKVKIVKISEGLQYTIYESPVLIGDTGFIIEIYKTEGYPDGYEIECILPDGSTKWVATFHLEDIELVDNTLKKEILPDDVVKTAQDTLRQLRKTAVVGDILPPLDEEWEALK